jgi:hypothetical protein
MYMHALTVQHKRKDAHTRSAKRRINKTVEIKKCPTSFPSLEQILPKSVFQASTPHTDTHDSSSCHSFDAPQVLWIACCTGPKSMLHGNKTLQQCFKEKFGNDPPHVCRALREAEQMVSAEEMAAAQQPTQGVNVYMLRAFHVVCVLCKQGIMHTDVYQYASVMYGPNTCVYTYM